MTAGSGEYGPVEPNNDEVICPGCAHQFRAIPVNVQAQLRRLEKDNALLRDALHLAYDWMGRRPMGRDPWEESWDRAHLDAAVLQVEGALRVPPSDREADR